ncbi:MAG: alpha-galactosidase [Abditibacteriota bacterium]|nr:alpha-galactosidase [Abditibacteriota bacterium]
MKKHILLLWTVIIMTLSSAAFASQAVELNKKAADMLFPKEKSDAPGQMLTILEDFSPGCTKIGMHCQGRYARLGEREFKRAIGVNSPSRVRVSLSKPCARLTGKYGLDSGVMGTIASVEFAVEAGGKQLMKTPVIKPDNVCYDLDVDLGGAKEFDLVVTMADDGPSFDQGDWCDLYAEYTDGTGEYINDICSEPRTEGVPFSFRYNGVPSEEFINRWEYSASDRVQSDRVLRTAVWKDPETKLEIKAVVNIYTLSPGIDWTFYAANKGGADTPVISDLKAMDVALSYSSCDRSATKYANPAYHEPDSYSKGVLPVLYRLRGTEGAQHFNQDDFMPVTDVLEENKPVTFGPIDAYSSHGAAFPFYTLACNGGGVVTGLGWTGQWQASCSLAPDGSVRSSAGMKTINTVLRPGEEIRTPRVLLCFYSGSDKDRGCNLFRQTMLRYVCPKNPDGSLQLPPMAHMTSCQHQDNSTTAEIEKQYIDTIGTHSLALDTYWLDAWWHKGGFPAGLGNYVYPLETAVDMDRFPEGVGGIGAYAKERGLKFLCWFAPETLSAGSKLAAAHPEWMLPKGAASGNFNLGDPEALKYITEFMDRCIKEWGIDIWRTDIGYTLGGIKKMEQETPDRVGILEIRQVEGLYKLWDALLKNNPGLMIDNCCGGGARIDLETSSRSISLWRTDCGVWAGGSRNLKGMAMLNQDNNICLDQYVPFSQCATLGNGPYYMRSGFNGGMTMDDDNRAPEYDNKTLKAGIDEAVRIRKYWTGDFYPLIFMSNSFKDWCAYQFDRPEEGDGVILVFRRDESPILSVELEPKGIDPKASYRLDIYGESYKKAKTVTVKGKALIKYPVAIKEAPGSALIEYKKIK